MMVSALLALLAQATAPAAVAPPSPQQIADAAPADAWRDVPADDLLIFTLADGGRVVVQLAPGFAPAHVRQIKALARAGWWNGATVYRVQDDYVAQWGDATEKKPLPAGITDLKDGEYDRPARGPIVKLHAPDSYAAQTGFSAGGWPVARGDGREWLPHCYGYVGVARDLAPSTGSGGDLYAVIGHAPRHLDRNIAVVGRVVEGIERLSALPRGTGKLGFYEDASQRVPIASAMLASDLPAGERPAFRYLAPTSATFARYIHARENREPPFFTRPAGGADICNVPVPIRHTAPR